MMGRAAPRTFAGPEEFRAWLAAHHASAGELLVRCFKTHASDRGLTYRQALEEALCWAWIDGVRRRVDEVSFSVRFSPRRPKSIWSAVNVRRAAELEARGRMAAPGLAAFRSRQRGGAEAYSFESRARELDPASLGALRARPRAWAFYQAQPPWYRRTTAFWVMSAKRPETRARRLGVLIACSERGTTIPPLTRNKGPRASAATPRRASGRGRAARTRR
jgi:uncharacterized protein YdeI (YjbR/CyaY-like superfamily)